MSDAISFWLDNKMASARKIAEIGDQTLVDYRGKFYVIRNGSAIMRGSKPLHFSKSSMPVNWKKAMRGETPALPLEEPDDGSMPKASVTRRVRATKEKETPQMQETTESVPDTTSASRAPAVTKPSKSVKKIDAKPAPQTVVSALCPYCSQKHEIPVEKGKNGKPFFVTCTNTKCATDFAVRFVPVTLFQAQVAAFR